MKRSLALLWLACCLPTLLSAASPAEDAFQKGLSAYRAESFHAARAIWKELGESSDELLIWTNLGTAAYHDGDYVAASAAYARALAMQPSNPDAHSGLRAAIEARRAGIEEPGKAAFLTPLPDMPLPDRIPYDVVLLAALASYLAFTIAALVASLRKQMKGAMAASLSGLGLLVLSSGLLFARAEYGLRSNGEAVLLQDSELYEGPDEGFKALAEAPAGSLVEVLEVSGEFVLVQPRLGTSAWVAKDHLFAAGEAARALLH